MVMNAVRYTLFHRQNGRCHYCSVHMSTSHKGPYHVTADHIRTKKEGGGDMIGNLVGACFRCNNMRGSIRYEAFKEYVTLYGCVQFVQTYKRISAEEIEQHKLMWAFIRCERLDVAWLAPTLYFGDRQTYHAPAGIAKAPPVNLAPAILPLRRPYLQLCRNLLKDIRLKFTYDQRKVIIEEGLALEQYRTGTQDNPSGGLQITGKRDGDHDERRSDGHPSGDASQKADDPAVADTRWTVSPSYFGRELFG